MRRRTLLGSSVRTRGPRGGFNFAVLGFGSYDAAYPYDKFFFDTCTSVNNQTLASIAKDGPSSFGSWNVGVFASGYTTSSTRRYLFGIDSDIAGTNLTAGTGRYGAGFGHALAGYSCLNGTTGKYIFESDVASTATAPGYSALLLAAISGQDYGMIGGGYSTIQTTDRYRFSNETRALGTNLSAGRYGNCGLSGPVYGVFVGGFNLSIYVTSTDEYDNATGTRTAGTTMSNSKQGGMGASDVHAGRVLGGQDSGGANYTVEAYNWTTKSSQIGSNRISYLRSYGGAVSACAPHLSATPPV